MARNLQAAPYSEHPELAIRLAEVASDYQDVREAQRQRVALGLSRTASSAELYIAARDLAEPVDDGGVYVAQIVGVQNVRGGNRMRYEFVVQGEDGDPGAIPVNFYVPFGVSAPAAKPAGVIRRPNEAYLA